MPHSIERKHCPMMKENRKLTETVMACPAERVSMVWISDGTCTHIPLTLYLACCIHPLFKQP